MRTAESIEKTASQLRGRKRPREVVDKIRQKNIGKKRTPEMVDAMRQRLIKGYADGKYRLTPEQLAARNLKISEANKGRIRTVDQRRQHSLTMTGWKWSDKQIESRASKMRNRPQTATATKMGPSHCRSIKGALRDSRGRIWIFTNLTNFVHSHQELFSAADISVVTFKSRPTRNCNASKRLLSLFGRGKHVPGTWKGWTVVSETELGEDLLFRNSNGMV